MSYGLLIRNLRKQQEQEALIRELVAALELITQMHDGNPPLPLADMPEVDYARRTISNIRYEARQALDKAKAAGYEP
jgi:hypothetical protein